LYRDQELRTGSLFIYLSTIFIKRIFFRIEFLHSETAVGVISLYNVETFKMKTVFILFNVSFILFSGKRYIIFYYYFYLQSDTL